MTHNAPTLPEAGASLMRFKRSKQVHRLMPIAALILATVLASCQKKPATAPENHSPTILSVIAFPDTIGPSDSTTVVCTASDQDGDSLVYDWQTDARLRVQGALTGDDGIFATRANAHVFYNANLSNPINDSAWVYCTVQDRRGGAESRIVFIALRRR
jgi:hypothetical protein